MVRRLASSRSLLRRSCVACEEYRYLVGVEVSGRNFSLPDGVALDYCDYKIIPMQSSGCATSHTSQAQSCKIDVRLLWVALATRSSSSTDSRTLICPWLRCMARSSSTRAKCKRHLLCASAAMQPLLRLWKVISAKDVRTSPIPEEFPNSLPHGLGALFVATAVSS